MYRDFFFLIEDDFNLLVNFVLVRFLFNLFLCYPLPCSLPSRSSAQTLRRGRQPEFGGKLVNFFGLIHFLVSFFVARYLAVSLRGPVLKPYDEGASPSCDGLDGWDGLTVNKKVL